jgi:hypothetical protein
MQGAELVDCRAQAEDCLDGRRRHGVKAENEKAGMAAAGVIAQEEQATRKLVTAAAGKASGAIERRKSA